MVFATIELVDCSPSYLCGTDSCHLSNGICRSGGNYDLPVGYNIKVWAKVRYSIEGSGGSVEGQLRFKYSTDSVYRRSHILSLIADGNTRTTTLTLYDSSLTIGTSPVILYIDLYVDGTMEERRQLNIYPISPSPGEGVIDDMNIVGEDGSLNISCIIENVGSGDLNYDLSLWDGTTNVSTSYLHNLSAGDSYSHINLFTGLNCPSSSGGYTLKIYNRNEFTFDDEETIMPTACIGVGEGQIRTISSSGSHPNISLIVPIRNIGTGSSLFKVFIYDGTEDLDASLSYSISSGSTRNFNFSGLPCPSDSRGYYVRVFNITLGRFDDSEYYIHSGCTSAGQSITVNSNPVGAIVRIGTSSDPMEAVNHGPTPRTVLDLGIGTFYLWLTKDGYVTHNEIFTLSPGEDINFGTIDLLPTTGHGAGEILLVDETGEPGSARIGIRIQETTGVYPLNFHFELWDGDTIITTGTSRNLSAGSIGEYIDEFTGLSCPTAIGYTVKLINEDRAFGSDPDDFHLVLISSCSGELGEISIISRDSETLEFIGVDFSITGLPGTYETFNTGEPRILSLPNGTYTITAVKEGYRTYVSDPIIVTTGITSNLTINMVPGEDGNGINPLIWITIPLAIGAGYYINKKRKENKMR